MTVENKRTDQITREELEAYLPIPAGGFKFLIGLIFVGALCLLCFLCWQEPIENNWETLTNPDNAIVLFSRWFTTVVFLCFALHLLNFNSPVRDKFPIKWLGEYWRRNVKDEYSLQYSLHKNLQDKIIRLMTKKGSEVKRWRVEGSENFREAAYVRLIIPLGGWRKKACVYNGVYKRLVFWKFSFSTTFRNGFSLTINYVAPSLNAKDGDKVSIRVHVWELLRLFHESHIQDDTTWEDLLVDNLLPRCSALTDERPVLKEAIQTLEGQVDMHLAHLEVMKRQRDHHGKNVKVTKGQLIDLHDMIVETSRFKATLEGMLLWRRVLKDLDRLLTSYRGQDDEALPPNWFYDESYHMELRSMLEDLEERIPTKRESVMRRKQRQAAKKAGKQPAAAM